MTADFERYAFRHRKNQVLLLAILLLSSLMTYFLIIRPADVLVLGGIAVFFVQLVSCLWCYYDGEEFSRPAGVQWGVAVFLFTPVALPLYLLCTRGWRAYQQFGGILLILFCIAVISYTMLFLYNNTELFHALWEAMRPKSLEEMLG